MIRRLIDPISRVVRRYFLGILLVGGVAMLGASIFGVRPPVGGAHYVEAVIGPPVRVHPLARHVNDAEDDLAALVFSGLMRIGPDGKPMPDLARSWEVTADTLTYTFHLRTGLAWHDGAPFSAADVQFTIERIQAPDFDGAPGLAAAWSGVQVFVADPATVLIRTPEPAADLLARAAIGLLPAHLEAEMAAGSGFDIAPFDRRPVGTGPFRLHSLDDRHALLERHAGFALDAPAIATVELRFVQDADAQVAALRAREADAALLGERVAAGEAAMLQRRLDLTETPLTRNGYTALYMNNVSAPLNETTLRRALAASIDRAAVLAAGGIRGTPDEDVIPPGSWLIETPDAEPAADIEALWDASAWERDGNGNRARDGVALSLELVTNADLAREAMAQAIATQLDERGVEVAVVTMPASRVIADRLQTGAFQLALFGWDAPADPDPYPGWHTSQSGGTGGNVAGFNDPEADALMEAARTTLDVGERRRLYALFDARFAEQAPALVIGYPARAYVHPRHLEGAEFGLLVSSGSRFSDVFRWKLP